MESKRKIKMKMTNCQGKNNKNKKKLLDNKRKVKVIGIDCKYVYSCFLFYFRLIQYPFKRPYLKKFYTSLKCDNINSQKYN